MVFMRGVLRSMSRPSGAGAQVHVGAGHDCTYGIGDWRRAEVVAKERKARIGMRAGRRRRNDIVNVGMRWKVDRKLREIF